MRRQPREFDDRVLAQRVELYVNDWTIDLGFTGARALDELSARGTPLDSYSVTCTLSARIFRMAVARP